MGLSSFQYHFNLLTNYTIGVRVKFRFCIKHLGKHFGLCVSPIRDSRVSVRPRIVGTQVEWFANLGYFNLITYLFCARITRTLGKFLIFLSVELFMKVFSLYSVNSISSPLEFWQSWSQNISSLQKSWSANIVKKSYRNRWKIIILTLILKAKIYW